LQDAVDECLVEGVCDAYTVEDEREVVSDETIACPLRHEREVYNNCKALFVGLGVPELEETESAFVYNDC
jgi:hypothetical protein